MEKNPSKLYFTVHYWDCIKTICLLKEFDSYYIKLCLNMKHSVLTHWVKPADHMALSHAKAQLVRKVRQANTLLLLHAVQIHLNWENGSSLSIRRHPSHLVIFYVYFYTSLKEYIVFQMKVGGWSGWWCRTTSLSQTKFNSTWELLFISHHGLAAGGHDEWLEQESRGTCEWA